MGEHFGQLLHQIIVQHRLLSIPVAYIPSNFINFFILLDWLDNVYFPTNISRMRKSYDYCKERLEKMGVVVHPGKATYFIWADLSKVGYALNFYSINLQNSWLCVATLLDDVAMTFWQHTSEWCCLGILTAHIWMMLSWHSILTAHFWMMLPWHSDSTHLNDVVMTFYSDSTLLDAVAMAFWQHASGWCCLGILTAHIWMMLSWHSILTAHFWMMLPWHSDNTPLNDVIMTFHSDSTLLDDVAMAFWQHTSEWCYYDIPF